MSPVEKLSSPHLKDLMSRSEIENCVRRLNAGEYRINRPKTHMAGEVIEEERNESSRATLSRPEISRFGRAKFVSVGGRGADSKMSQPPASTAPTALST